MCGEEVSPCPRMAWETEGPQIMRAAQSWMFRVDKTRRRRTCHNLTSTRSSGGHGTTPSGELWHMLTSGGMRCAVRHATTPYRGMRHFSGILRSDDADCSG